MSEATNVIVHLHADKGTGWLCEACRAAGYAEGLAAAAAIDLGMYPEATPDGPRTEWQDGWNAGAEAVFTAIDALSERGN